MKHLLSDIWDAIRGHEHDYTRIGLGKAILLLSIPMVLEMLMESIFALTDMFFVSRLGDEAVAVVGLTESIMTLVYALAVGLSMATTGIVARRIGENHDRGAAVAAAQAILLGIFISILISQPGIFFPGEFLNL